MIIGNLFWRVISWFATFGCFIAGVFSGTNGNDVIARYYKNVEKVGYENTFETALPQTDIYNIVDNFLKSDPAEGKTDKKVLVIGYDGCRADALALIDNDEESAIRTLTNEGGELLLSYCGGVNYPKINTQDTSTAPGWCSMLTGVWANVNGVKGNGIPKSNEYLSLLTSAVEDGTIDSSAFYVSWGGHFSDSDSTYVHEKEYIEEKALNVNFLRAGDDDGTKENVLADIQKADCSDFIFSIFEYCDHIGHSVEFNITNSEYAGAFKDSELTGLDLINAVKARDTYESEDWLIIITSDHGGYNNWHGGPTMQERYTFIASNQPLDAEKVYITE